MNNIAMLTSGTAALLHGRGHYLIEKTETAIMDFRSGQCHFSQMNIIQRILLGSLLCLGTVEAETFRVGPGQAYANLQSVLNAENLEPGDIVEVDGGTLYDGGVTVDPSDGGAPGNPVLIRGNLNGGSMPHLRGGNNTLHNRASHITFESIEISGTGNTSSGTFRCFFHQGTGVTLRGVFIHDCPRQGILGADQDSGSLTVEYSVVMNAGSGGRNHAIYMSTDQVAYPGSVFRLQYSHISDSQFNNNEIGGNLIKSRAERNEIYYNWLEGGFYHELELIGPDPGGVASGWTEGLAREDSDIVGNIIVHSADFGSILRFGGDATGQSFGRYRFVHNTVIRTNGGQATVFRLFDGLESLQADNNVFFNTGSSAFRMVREVEAIWLGGNTTITGSGNWIESGSTFLPSGFSNTRQGGDPGFENISALDLRPAAGSSLVDAAAATQTPPGFDISSPLSVPVQHPPADVIFGALQPTFTPIARPLNNVLDVGALEREVQGLIFTNGFEG
ncbi:MAG: hypothetical protein AB8B96_08700 [Lysobacterales bacterium]